MAYHIKQAVFPVGGLGTRFFPATKALPKEMLPVVDKPLIQYAVEEALASGIEHCIFITGRDKTAIENHFDGAPEWETILRERLGERVSLLECHLKPGQIAYTRQQEPLGLGHAVWCARHLLHDEPFAVILADDLIHAQVPCLQQMLNHYTQGYMVATMKVNPENTPLYGILHTDPSCTGPLYPAQDLVEKPPQHEAPSTMAVMGRYILEPHILQVLEHQARGTGGEIQLTDALRGFAHQGRLQGFEFEGRRLDCGVKEEWILAQVVLGLERPDLKDRLRALLDHAFPQGF